MEWNTSTYSYNLLERLNVSRNVQPRHFLIELFRREIDIFVVSPEAGMIAELEQVCSRRFLYELVKNPTSKSLKQSTDPWDQPGK